MEIHSRAASPMYHAPTTETKDTAGAIKATI